MISVCMATYNGEKYLKEQLDSILCQIGEDDEVIVSDDGSTDATLDIISSYQDARIKVLNHKCDNPKYNNHQKVSANFENAINQAIGDWIFLSDQDDVWAPNRVKETSKYFYEYDLVVCDCCFLVNDNIDLSTSKLKNKDPLLSILGIPPNYHGCCMAFKASCKRIILPFPKNLYVHDAWIGHVIRLRGRGIIIRDKLVYYRLHESNVSVRKGRKDIIYTITHRLKFIKQLFYRLIVENCHLHTNE